MKISDSEEEEEDKMESPVSSCLSMKSDRSRGYPPAFSNEPEPSDTKQRAESPVSGRLSMKSDRSRGFPPAFSHEPGPVDTKERTRSHVPVEESCCALCQDILKDPVSTSCGHWFCRQCITSYWDQLFIRRLLFPVWRKIQNKTRTAEGKSGPALYK
ncbi:E3 ubiquitin-protein ligase TRAF7 isoform X2 [Larimichthys crocea]|nr:E3 ubiquitin-protein ligase TRAF7 isoform X2 [Larimichthys crocea]